MQISKEGTTVSHILFCESRCGTKAASYGPKSLNNLWMAHGARHNVRKHRALWECRCANATYPLQWPLHSKTQI